MAAAVFAFSHSARSGAVRRRSPASITTRQSAGGRREQRLDRGHEVAAAGPDPDRARAAEQRHGVRLLDQPRRLGRELVAVEPHQRERIVRIVDRGADDRLGALAHQAGVGAEHQHDRARRIGARDEGIDVGSAAIIAVMRASRTRLQGSRLARDQRRRRCEIGREARADVLGDHLGGAVLGVALAAHAREALLLARDVVGRRARRCGRSPPTLPVASSVSV